MDVFRWLTNTATRLSEENIANVTKVKEVYSCWESNDDGEDLTLYKGFAADGVTPRYFLKHFKRDWDGGWSYDESATWYEIPEQEYLKLCKNN